MKQIVKMVSKTEDPVWTMMYAFMNMHNEIPNSLREFKEETTIRLGLERTNKLRKDFLVMLASNPHSSVLEFVNTVWVIKGCTRAFQQQLTRTRLAAYSIQSLRIVDVGSFVSDDAYGVPDSVRCDDHLSEIYDDAMLKSNESYNTLLAAGASVQDARGVLPLNICSPITFSINLRALIHMLEVRLCNLTQGEFRSVAALMVEEIWHKLGTDFLALFQKPCDKAKKCPMPVNCGKTKYKLDETYKNMDLDFWLKG